jgi:uncharacterized protein YecT (DUF1311 family)
MTALRSLPNSTGHVSRCTFAAACLFSVLMLSSRVHAQAGASGPTQPDNATALTYDKAIFQSPVPADQLAPLTQFTGAPTNDLIRDKQFRKLMKNFIPDVMFHYGRDMPLDEALDMALKGSREPVQLRENRYLILSGDRGEYLSGRGFLWIDLQDGIGVGGFFFHPTNGEPTPSLTVFSKQIRQNALSLGELPPAFAQVLGQWAGASRIPPITTRYFIGGLKKRILLEHDEDYCSPADGNVAPPGGVCEQMLADAADLDLNTANYLEQVHHATNATAWMINGDDQIAWLQVRNNSCGLGPNPLGCRVRMTRARVTIIVRPHPMPHPHR